MNVDLLRTATDEFGARLARVDPDRYVAPTPCSDWDVGHLVDHVITANRLVTYLLQGVERAEAMARAQAEPRSADRRVDFPISADAQLRALETAAPDLPVVTLVGVLPAAGLLGIRTVDLLVHAWDLARALGLDERLPAEVVAGCLAIAEPQQAWMATSGVFGPGAAGAPQPADDQERLLQLTGRRPR